MKRLFILMFFITSAYILYGQSEVNNDTFTVRTKDNYIKYGDYLLDLALFKLPEIPKFDWENYLGIDMTKDYSKLIIPDLRWTYSQGSIYSGFSNTFYGFSQFGNQQWQKASFKINDTMQLNLYGEYRADGHRIHNPNANPWEKNDFAGGMELKINKNFGIRLELRRNNHYHPFYP